MRGIPKALWLGVAVATAAAVVLAAGLSDTGFWTDAELPVVDRARAALGESLSGLERSPWFPDAVRTRFFAAFGSEFGIRLPHAISVAALAGVAAGLVRKRGATMLWSLLAAVVLLSFPVSAVGSSTVLGNPVGELLLVAAVVAGVRARDSEAARSAAVWALLCAALVALAVASIGLVFGAAAVLLAVAVYPATVPRRGVTPVLTAAAIVVAAVAIGLAWTQSDGYIPVLGASKELDLIDKPEQRRYAAALEDFGYQIFPWVGLAAAGAVRPQARWPALWALSTLALAVGWSLLYGSTPIPVTVPAAMCVVAAAETIADPEAPKNLRRITVALGIVSILIMRKDADLYPSRIAVPLHDWGGEHHFPDEALGVSKQLRRAAGVVALGLLIAAVVARRRDDEGGWEALARRIPAPVRDTTATVAILGAATVSAWTMHGPVTHALADAFSPREALQHYGQWVETGELEAPLGIHRIRDDGVAYYGPQAVESLSSRHDVFTFLQSDSPRAALVRINDVAAVHQHAQLNHWSMYVLDDSHARLRLVANTLPAGATDYNRIPEILVEDAPPVRNETLVQFEQYVKVVGWELDGPLIRGEEATATLIFEVLRPLPGGSKLYLRLMDGRLSKIHVEPVEFADGLYPCNLWRPGDIIVHTETFDVPPLEVLPGTYDVVVGIRRSEKKNLEISIPAEREGEYGVRVHDKKRSFAKIGKVKVW